MMKMHKAVVAIAGLGLLASAYAEAPRHVRHFPRTLYFSEIPLNTTYGNGNMWSGWTGRWVDWPLMIDRSIPYIEGRHYRVTWPDLLRTLTEMKLGGDGCRDLQCCAARERNADRCRAGSW